MRQFAIEPCQVPLGAAHYLHSDYFRHLVGMQSLDFDAEIVEQQPAGLDHEQHLLLFLDSVFPVVKAAHNGQHVYASRQPFLDQRARQPLRFLERSAGAEYNNFVGHVSFFVIALDLFAKEDYKRM